MTMKNEIIDHASQKTSNKIQTLIGLWKTQNRAVKIRKSPDPGAKKAIPQSKVNCVHIITYYCICIYIYIFITHC